MHGTETNSVNIKLRMANSEFTVPDYYRIA